MEEEKSKVERLDDRLYSRTRYENPLNTRSGVHRAEGAEVSPDWQTPGLDEMLTRERKPLDRTPFMKKFFIFAVLFFLATMIVAGFVFFGGSNFISSKNLDIAVVGPAAVPAGEPLELQVTVKNGNNADLELANFSVQYPTGARDEADSSKGLTFAKEDLGVIEAGHEVVRTLNFVLIGESGEAKELKLSVEYKVKGSNATFYKDKIYTVTIGSSPLAMSTNVPASVSSGEEFLATVSVTLNSTEVLKNAMIKAEYPYGFSFVSSTPEPLADNNVWALGDMSPGMTKRIDIRGRLTGENQDERTIRFYAGAAEGDKPAANFKTTIISIQRTLSIERPSIALTTRLNGETGATYVAPAGQGVEGRISYKNNLSTKLLNPKISLTFTGAALDKASVSTFANGFYDSTTDTITWPLTGNAGTGELAPGAGGEVSFRLASRADLTAVEASRGITLEITLTGTPFGTQSPVSVKETRALKIASQVAFDSKVLHSTGVFDNRGTLPPRVSQETTYTVVWSLRNTQNQITDATASAHLGPGVKWLGAATAQGENVSYDEGSNTVTWKVGTLESGVGFTTPVREISFQVSLTPSLSQVGTVPILVNTASFSGFESLAAKTINLTNAPLTTRLSSDPAFVQGDDVVQK